MSRKAKIIVAAIALAAAGIVLFLNNGLEASPLVIGMLGLSLFLFIGSAFMSE
jgi:hypothetical protein